MQLMKENKEKLLKQNRVEMYERKMKSLNQYAAVD